MGHHPRLATSSVCSFSWDLDRDLAMWAAQEITVVGVAYITMQQAGLEHSVAKIADAGLTVVDLIGLGPFRLDEPHTWARARREVQPVLDAAVELQVGTLVFTPGWAGDLPWEDAAKAFVDAFGPLVETATARGVRVSIENASGAVRNESGFIPTLPAAVELAGRVGAGVCVEIHNCWQEPDLARTFADSAGRFNLIQLSDSVTSASRRYPLRGVPGDGDLPLGEIVRLALDAGYSGPFELEIIGPLIDEEGPAEAVARSLAALDALFAELDVPA